MDINNVVVSGRLTRDAEVRATSGGGSVIRFGMAVNDRRRNAQTNEWEDRPNFIECVMFDNSGSRKWMPQHLVKGFHVVVQGRLRYDSWEKDGQKRSRIEVVVDNIEATWPKKNTQTSYSSTPAITQATMQQDTYYDDDMPF